MSKGKVRGLHRKIFYFLTGQLRLKKLEAKLARLEHDHYEHVARFAATAAYYEQRIDTLVNFYSKLLAQEEEKNT